LMLTLLAVAIWSSVLVALTLMVWWVELRWEVVPTTPDTARLLEVEVAMLLLAVGEGMAIASSTEVEKPLVSTLARISGEKISFHFPMKEVCSGQMNVGVLIRYPSLLERSFWRI